MGSAGKRDAVGPGREKLCEDKCINEPGVLFIFKHTLATKLKKQKQPVTEHASNGYVSVGLHP